MRVFHPFSAALALTVLSVGVADANATGVKLRLNGWFACGSSSSPKSSDTPLKLFECAEVDVPLCHEGVKCESDRTISLFVKRLPANATEEHETQKSLWMLQGEPGGSSVNMESTMLKIHRLLEFKANLYTVDHRGTGRSFFLQCDAAQAFTSGSPTGVGLSMAELPDCLRDVLFQIDNQPAAFSVTSAAKDVEFLVQNLHNEGEEVYVYGASYGTYLAERVMHLAPSNVNGYVLDGVVAEDSASNLVTAGNTDNVAPTKRLAQYCEESEPCAAMFEDFKEGELYTKWQEMYDELDALEKGENDCADSFRYQTVGDEATMVSSTIKYVLGPFTTQRGGRELLPGMFKLIHRCQDNDLQTIQAVKTIAQEGNSNDPSCDALTVYKELNNQDRSQIKPPQFTYETDEYYETFATIPDDASVLVINGRLDFQTVSDNGVREYENLKGGRGKMMVEMDYGGHCSGIYPSIQQDKTECGLGIIASFVEQSGDVETVDTSCMEELPQLNLLSVDLIVQATKPKNEATSDL